METNPAVVPLGVPFLLDFHSPRPLAMTQKPAGVAGSDGPLSFIFKDTCVAF